MAAISVAIMADIPADLAPSIICLAVEISLSYRIVLTVRYVLTPASRHSAAMAARSSIVKLTAARERMFSPCMPKYTASAPADMAARRDS